MNAKVWVDIPLMPTALNRLSAETEVILDGTLADLPGISAAILGGVTLVNGDFMDAAGESLLAVARHGIGVDNVDIPAATERGILVINTPDAPTESTAEHAVALLLSLAKRVVLGDASLRGTGVPHPKLMGTEVRSRVLGIVGCGRIGRRVAEICSLGLKMTLISYDPHCDWAKQGRGLDIEVVDSLDTLLSRADFVTLHTPLTEETYHMIGERELQLMKPGAYLINTSRGPVVDELALAKVMGEGHLAGSALDVFDPEPPAPDNPLLRLSNVVVTPHIASFTDLGYQAMADGAVDQVLQVLRGERPPHLLNPETWPGRIKRAP